MVPKFIFKVIFLFLFVFSIAINAQFKIGITSGANFASYTISDKASNVDLTHKLGISIGAMAEYNLTGKLATRISIKYVQRGGENKIALSGIISLFNIQNY